MAMDLRQRLKETDDILLHYYPLHSALADWGKDLESHLSEWIITHPEAYQEAIVKSLEAGCDFVSTSTQAASPWRAKVFGFGHKVREHNYLSAKLAREVTPKDRYLAGFVSTTNPDFLEPLGAMTRQEVYDGYKEQIEALLEGGVDLIMIVGNHIEEGVIAIEVTRDLGDVPVVSQNVYYRGKKGFRSLMGHDPGGGSRRLLEVGSDVVGASCGLMKRPEDAADRRGYFAFATELVQEMRAGCQAILSIQPNAGLAQLVDGRTTYPATPEELAAEAPNWIKAGARIVGGCCGTSLEHYRRLAEAVRGSRGQGPRP
ncbi:MAG: homocysteine S-methyltransferase family protein [Thermodesulfobacteriota bacterium]